MPIANEPEIAFPISPAQAGIQSLRKKAEFGTQALYEENFGPGERGADPLFYCTAR